MDRKNKHTANKNKQSKYGKLYFIEHSSEYLSTWIFYLSSHTEILYIHGHFKLRNMKDSHTELGPSVVRPPILRDHPP